VTAHNRRDFLALTTAATFGSSLAATTTARADAPRPVRVLAVPSDSVSALLYAKKANLFLKHGIDATIGSMGGGATIFAAVLGGSAEFGSGSVWPVFEACGRGIPLRIVAPISIYSSARPDAFLFVRTDSPIRVARDLNGKVMGADSTSPDITVMATRSWIDQHGGDGSSLRSIELTKPEQVESLLAGRIDVVSLRPPFLSVARQQPEKFRVLGTPYDSIGSRWLLSCWVATADFIAQNPDVVKGFVAALIEAAHYTNAHQAETIDLVAAFSGQDAATLAKGPRNPIAEAVSLAELQAPLDFAYKYGVIAQHVDLSTILAPSFPISRS